MAETSGTKLFTSSITVPTRVTKGSVACAGRLLLADASSGAGHRIIAGVSSGLSAATAVIAESPASPRMTKYAIERPEDRVDREPKTPSDDIMTLFLANAPVVVDLAPMANGHHADNQLVVAGLAQVAGVADAVSAIQIPSPESRLQLLQRLGLPFLTAARRWMRRAGLANPRRPVTRLPEAQAQVVAGVAGSDQWPRIAPTGLVSVPVAEELLEAGGSEDAFGPAQQGVGIGGRQDRRLPPPRAGENFPSRALLDCHTWLELLSLRDHTKSVNMPPLHPRFIAAPDGQRVSVLLPLAEYEALMERLEDLEDLEEAREVLARIARGEEEIIPWATVKAELGL